MTQQANVISTFQQIAGKSHFHVLVNNVGRIFPERQVSIDGIEMTFAVNHLVSFLLTDLMLETLKASAPARVVTVSSAAQAQGRINFDDLQSEQRYREIRVYNQSKLANVLFSYELARRLAGTGVTANVLEPGFVKTNMAVPFPFRLFSPMRSSTRRFRLARTMRRGTPCSMPNQRAARTTTAA